MAQITIVRTVQLPESSIIKQMHYNVNTEVLTVTFNTNRTYIYSDVPDNIVKEMCKSKSVGSYFREFIRDVYAYEEV
jgi:hypothetical protein